MTTTSKTAKASAKAKAVKAKAKAVNRPAKAQRKPLAFDYAEVERLAGLGLTQEKIAIALGCSERTITNKLNNDANFAEAYARGKASREVFVASKLQERIEDGDTSAIKFYLSSQCDWREARDQRVSGGLDVDVNHGGEVAVDVTNLSLERLIRLAELED